MEHLNEKNYAPCSAELWHSNTPRLLVYTPYAARRQLDVIGWLRNDFPRNRKEQGGWLIGRNLHNEAGQPGQAEVVEILEAETECRYPGYIEWSGWEEIRLQQKFFAIKDALAAKDPQAAEELRVLGWWHSHTHDTPVFMSKVDRETQRDKFFHPEDYAVVLNPHRGIWRAFVGANATEVAAIMLMVNYNAGSEQDAPRHNKHERNCRRQNRHQKRCKSRKKTNKRK